MKLLPAFLQPGSSSSSAPRRRKTLDATTRPQLGSTLFSTSNINSELAVPPEAVLASGPSQSSFISQPPATPSFPNASPASASTPQRSQSTLVKADTTANNGARTRRRSLRNLFGLRPQFVAEQQNHPVPALPDLGYSPASSDTASSPATSLAASDSTSNNSPLSALSPLKNGRGRGEDDQYRHSDKVPATAGVAQGSDMHRLSLGLPALPEGMQTQHILRNMMENNAPFEKISSPTTSGNTLKAGKALDSPLLKQFPRSNEGHDEDGLGSDDGESDEVGTEEAYGKPSEDGHVPESYSQQNRKEAPLPPLPISAASSSIMHFPAALSINLTKVNSSPPSDSIKTSSPRSATSARSSIRVLSVGAKACLDLTLSKLRPEQQASSVKGLEAIGGGSTSRVYPTSSRLYLNQKNERKVNRTLCTTLHRANIAWRLESRKLTLMEEVELDGLKRLSAKGDLAKLPSPTTLSPEADRARKDIAIKALNEAGPDDILVEANGKEQSTKQGQSTTLLIKTDKLRRQDAFLKAQVRAWKTWIEREAFEERKIVILPAEHAASATAGVSGTENMMTIVRPVVPRHAHSLAVSGKAKCLADIRASVYTLTSQAEVAKSPKRISAQLSITPSLPLQSGTAAPAEHLKTQSSSRPSLPSSSSAPAISSLCGSASTSAVSSVPRSSSVKDSLSTPSKRPISNLSPQAVVVTRPTPPRHSSLPPSAPVAALTAPDKRNKRVSLLSRIATNTARPPREAPHQRPFSTMLPSSASDRPNRQAPAHERSQSASVTSDIGQEGGGEDEDEMPLAYWRDRQSMVSDGSSSYTSDKSKRFSAISNSSYKQPSPIFTSNRQSLLVPPLPSKQSRQQISSSTSSSNISQNAEVAALQAEIAALKAAQAKTLQHQKEMDKMKEAEFTRMQEERLKASIREETARKEKEEEETRKKRDERKRWEDHRRRSAMLDHQQKEQDKAEEETRRRSSYMPSGMPGYAPPESHRRSILFSAASPPQLYQPQPIYPIGPAMQQHQQPFVHPMFYAASGGMPMHQYQPQNTFIHLNAMMSAPNLSYMPDGQMTAPYPLSFTPPATPPRYPSPRRESPNRLSGHSFSSNEDSAAGGPLKDKRRSSYLPAFNSAGKMSELLQLAQQYDSELQAREPNFNPDGLIQQATSPEQVVNPRAMLARSQGRSASYDSSQSANELSKSGGRSQAVPVPIPRSMSDPRNAQRGSRAFLDIPAQRKNGSTS